MDGCYVVWFPIYLSFNSCFGVEYSFKWSTFINCFLLSLVGFMQADPNQMVPFSNHLAGIVGLQSHLSSPGNQWAFVWNLLDESGDSFFLLLVTGDSGLDVLGSVFDSLAEDGDFDVVLLIFVISVKWIWAVSLGRSLLLICLVFSIMNPLELQKPAVHKVSASYSWALQNLLFFHVLQLTLPFSNLPVAFWSPGWLLPRRSAGGDCDSTFFSGVYEYTVV